MKLRIRGNSLRVRLQQSEVGKFLEEGRITEIIKFGEAEALHYSLEVRDGLSKIGAEYKDHEILILVPLETARNWASGDTIEMNFDKPLPSGDILRILVEKDFQCLKPRSVWKEDESDAYPNPNPSCGHE